MKRRNLIALTIFLVCVNTALAQTTAFTYQGKLIDAGNPPNGNYDMQFKLFDTSTVGTGVQQGPTITNPSVSVAVGIFSVQLDFGAGAFSGPPRYLEIGVRPMGSPDPYTLLSPRQAMTSTPYSVRSLNSAVADVLSSACVGCVSSLQVGSVSGSAVTGEIPVASVPAGSGNYVQNTTLEQAPASFNIRGSGTVNGAFSASTANITNTASANIFNATTQFNIGGSRAFIGSNISHNVFAGLSSGTSSGGNNNSFFGHGAGEVNVSGASNSFFGYSAGNSNTASNNSFFGAEAGFGNTSGTRNSFFGLTAGRNNQTGSDNAFFGYRAGLNSTASFNSFFGSGAGDSNTSGANNAYFGYNAGGANLTGLGNAFFGYHAGAVNTVSLNSFFGANAGDSNSTGTNNAFFGYNAGQANTTGSGNSFFGFDAGLVNTGSLNTFIGKEAGINNTTGSNNTIIGTGADVGLGNLSFATAIGAGAIANSSNDIKLGRDNGLDTVFIPGNVQIYNGGTLKLFTLGSAGSINLCQNGSAEIATCSSSLRYKTDVQTFMGGLDVVRSLHPITFNWKDGGMHDVGFGAEEVEKIEPLLTTRNSKGEIEGVKYGQVTTVLVNAVQQQQQIIEQQQRQIDALKKLVCLSHPQADVCK
jgi:hypothetical protein